MGKLKQQIQTFFKEKDHRKYYFDRYGNHYLSEHECVCRRGVFYETTTSSSKKAIRNFKLWLKTW